MRELGVVMRGRPMGMPLTMLAGWINRPQQDVIVYLKEENKFYERNSAQES